MKRDLLQNLKRSYTENSKAYNQIKDAVDKRVETLVAGSTNENTTEEGKAAIIKQVREAQEATTMPNYIDPLGLATRIQELETEINFITNELDWTLSDSNTNTTVDVEI